MHNRRFTRLTNAFSKKFENHAHMVAIYTVWYNFIRIHKTLKVTPAMEAGIKDGLVTWETFWKSLTNRPRNRAARRPIKSGLLEIQTETLPIAPPP